MSNLDDQNPEFDDLDLGEMGFEPPDASDEPGGLPDFGSSADMLEPGAESLDTGAADALSGTDAAALAPVEVTAEEKEEEPEEEEKEKGPGLLARLTKTSPYVVLLGISLVAILIGILCLWLELQRYDGEIKPPQVGAVQISQPAPPGIMATA